MTFRRVAAALAVGAAVAAVPVAGRRHRRRRLPWRRALLVWFLGSSWAPWDPVWDALTGIGSSIKDAIKAMLDPVIGWVEAGFAWVTALVQNVSDALWATATMIVGWLNAGLAAVRNFAVSIVAELRDATWGLVAGVVDLVHGLVDGLVSWVRSGLDWLQAQVNHLLQWVVDNVLTPFLSFVAGIFDWIRDNIFRPLWDLIHGLIDGVWSAITWLRDRFGDVWHWFVDELPAVWGLLQAVWWFLVWVAEHPFTWWRDLFDDLTRQAPRTVLGWVTHAWQSDGATLEDEIVRWLG